MNRVPRVEAAQKIAIININVLVSSIVYKEL